VRLYAHRRKSADITLRAIGFTIGGTLLAACSSSQQARQSSAALIPTLQQSLAIPFKSECHKTARVTLNPYGGVVTFPTCVGYTLTIPYSKVVPRHTVKLTIEDGNFNYNNLPPPNSNGTPLGGTDIFYYSECCPSSGFNVVSDERRARLVGSDSRRWNRSKDGDHSVQRGGAPR
jgi:hypothetical protein